MGIVIRVDLRDEATRREAGDAAPGGMLTTLYERLADSADMTELPIRLLLLLPLDPSLATDAEALALSLLGVDPAPRTLVLVVPGGPGVAPIHQPIASQRILPSEFARHVNVRFVDLRGSMVTVGNPRSGVRRMGTGPTDRWAPRFIEDLALQLGDPATFDSVWSSIPQDRPAALGMRIVELGVGRDRAIADLAFRLAEDLKPDHEPPTGRPLPERWPIEPDLLPAPMPAVRYAGIRDRLPLPVKAIGSILRSGPRSLLKRPPADYNRAALESLRLVQSEPERLALAFERAAGRDGETGPTVDPVGAVELDRAVGGLVFGDPVAAAFESGEQDAVARVAAQLEVAADRSSEGLPLAILIHWLREDAGRILPMGPRAAAAYLRDAERTWAQRSRAINRLGDGPEWPTLDWLPTALSGELSRPPGSPPPPPPPASSAGTAQAETIAGTDTPPDAAASKRKGNGSSAAPAPSPVAQAGATLGRLLIPHGMGAYLGSIVWRHPAATALFLVLIVGALAAGAAQWMADRTGRYLIDLASIGPFATGATWLPYVLAFLAVLAIVYLIVSVLSAFAVRRWSSSLGFDQVPAALEQLHADAAALATAEVARCAPRRELARITRAAADTLELGATSGSEAARRFAEGIDPSELPLERPHTQDLPPYREPLGQDLQVAGTDAGGIYRIYPIYVEVMRRMYSAALLKAIRERWPRVRGVFWQETADLIAVHAAEDLARRLQQLRDAGIRRGDLVRDGIDPADEAFRQLWADPSLKGAALRALNFTADDPITVLASPSEQRLLDATHPATLIVVIPATLEGLLAERIVETKAAVVVSDLLETATVIRVFPFMADLYTYQDAVLSRAT